MIAKHHASLELILDNSDALICLINKQGNYQYQSVNWQRFFLSNDKINNIFSTFCPISQQTIKSTITKCVKKLNKERCQVVYDRNLEKKHYRFDVSPITIDNQTLFVITANNVCPEVELEKENVNLRSFVNAAGDVSRLGFWQLDVASKELYWSDEVYNIHAVDKNEYQPKLESAIEFYHPDDIQKVQQFINQGIEQGQEWYFQLRIVRPNGEVRDVISSGNVHFNEMNQPDHVFGVFQDVTEQQQLQQERDLLDLAVAQSEVGVVMTDAKSNVLWSNKGFEQLTGYSFTDVSHRSVLSLLRGPNTCEETIKQISTSLNSGTPVNTEILNYHKSGQPFWSKLIITPVFKDNKLTHFIGIQHDISEVIFVRDQLAAINASLENNVQKRTAELENLNQQLKEQSRVDPLTGALNRRAFFENADKDIKRCARNQQPISFALIDIDHFKKVNDQYGHNAGDTVLQYTVSAIKSHLRETDELYRIGGEEFVVIMQNTSVEQSKVVAERIRTAVESNQIPINWFISQVTVSMGIFTQTGAVSIRDSIKNADIAMYKAKKQGRNSVVSH